MDFSGLGFRPGTELVQGIATSGISAGKTLTVNVNGTVVTARSARDITIASGDVVVLIRLNDQLVAIARLFAAAPAAKPEEEDDPPPPPRPTTVYGTTIINPVETRSYRPNWGWRNDNDAVYQGEYSGGGNHTGCAFYGNKPKSLDGVTVLSATLRAKRIDGGVFAHRATTLRRISNRTRPSGAPTLIAGSADGPDLAVGKTDTSVDVPASWAQDLVDGDAGGLAIFQADGSPYVRLAGRGSYSSSFALTIKWKRTS